jgi:hypothetical protein
MLTGTAIAPVALNVSPIAAVRMTAASGFLRCEALKDRFTVKLLGSK